MELEILKKKMSSYKGEGGRLRKLPDDLLLEILSSWEQWTGSGQDFYKELGSNFKTMAKIMGKAKRLKREGYEIPFKEIAVEGITGVDNPQSAICDIELQEQNKIIRFRRVDLLIEYLKKAA